MKIPRPALVVGRATALLLCVHLACGLETAKHTILPGPRALLGAATALLALGVVASFERRDP